MTGRRLATALTAVGLGLGSVTAAQAAPTPLVIAPTGWRADPEASAALSQKLAATSPFGSTAVTAAEVYVPTAPGAILYVSRTRAELADRGAAARAAIDGFRATAASAKLLGARLEIVDDREATVERQHVVTFAWRDAGQQISSVGRLVLAADSRTIVAVTGECVTAANGAAASARCAAALDTLDTGLPVADRVELEVAAAADAPAPLPTTPSRTSEPARLDDVNRIKFAPIVIGPPPRRAEDRRTLYIGAGIVLLAIVFWWNRQRRDQFERRDAVARGERTADEPAADADADALHAAARDATPEDDP